MKKKITQKKTDRKPEFYHPSVTADVLCLERSEFQDRLYLYLIRRSPLAKAFPGCLAIPGGFMDANDDSIEACAVRELREETGIEIDTDDLILNGVHTRKGRDPRGPVHSTSFYAHVGRNNLTGIIAGDDAAEVVKCVLSCENGRIELSDGKGRLLSWIAVSDIGFCDNVKVINKPSGIAFDHAEIIATMVSNLIKRKKFLDDTDEEVAREKERKELIAKQKEKIARLKDRIATLEAR